MVIDEILPNYCIKAFSFNNGNELLNKKYDFAASKLNALFKLSNGLKAKGLENLEELKFSPYVIVANHKTSLDPIYVICALKDYKKIRWVSKAENFSGKVYSKFMEIGQVIPLGEDRKMTPYAWKRVNEVIDNNEALGIFPEGTRNKSGGLLEFHTGAARICCNYNIPYVPVGINGFCKPFKGEVLINIGEPVYLEDCLDYRLEAANMRDKIMQLI